MATLALAPAAAAPKRPSLVFPIVIACLCLGAFEAAQAWLGDVLREMPTSAPWAICTVFLPWVWMAMLMPGVLWVAERWPLDRGHRGRALAVHVVALFVFCIVHLAGMTVLGVYFARAPGPGYYWLFIKLLLYRSPLDVIAYGAVVGAAHAVRAAREAGEREQAAVRLEASLAEARLAALRDRLDPHFVFNTLNAVNTLALRGDNHGVVRTVDALSDLLRQTLDETRGQEVALSRELAFLDRYLEIQELRFGDRLTITRDIDPALLDAAVPVMLTQPLVENAVQHGAAVKPGPARIDVRVRRDGDALVVEIGDAGPGFVGTPSRNGRGIGLANCRARLAGLYGDRASIVCANREEGGALVTVRLPFRRFEPVDAAT